jgi:Animal haem peroxidase.
VDDVDLYTAGLAEFPLPDAMLGPTLVCLLGDQFSRLKRGDRFFYEEGGQPSTFTQDQLREIRKTSLARVICDNADNIQVMQPLAFLKPSIV